MSVESLHTPLVRRSTTKLEEGADHGRDVPDVVPLKDLNTSSSEPFLVEEGSLLVAAVTEVDERPLVVVFTGPVETGVLPHVRITVVNAVGGHVHTWGVVPVAFPDDEGSVSVATSGGQISIFGDTSQNSPGTADIVDVVHSWVKESGFVIERVSVFSDIEVVEFVVLHGDDRSGFFIVLVDGDVFICWEFRLGERTGFGELHEGTDRLIRVHEGSFAVHHAELADLAVETGIPRVFGQVPGRVVGQDVVGGPIQSKGFVSPDDAGKGLVLSVRIAEVDVEPFFVVVLSGFHILPHIVVISSVVDNVIGGEVEELAVRVKP